MLRKNPFVPFLLLWSLLVVAAYVLLAAFVPLVPIILMAASLTVATFLLFGIDKFQAGRNGLRVPERLFFLTVALGGSLGALLGMNVFRHKTRKTDFQFVIILLILVQLGIVYLAWRYL